MMIPNIYIDKTNQKISKHERTTTEKYSHSAVTKMGQLRWVESHIDHQKSLLITYVPTINKWLNTPSLPLQSVTAFCLWHEGDLYDNWSAAGLSTSDNAKLRAIADSIHQAYDVGLEDIQQVHVFSDSTNMLHLTMDVSHHSGQHLSLSICKVLVLWL
jgi:hypothetical protein